ncbi:response regulator transcription factor [Sporanaerobium hydrogeniformans]|uniref:response regulator transcription factor n=1 Tax=Sporanaerobium hydrogeniformans TaxID=3072179 RepID=UPI0015D5214F|nr:helix-turn-helix domain-containing protein [Sporanaerobium hydrogeniformans]
MYRALIIDDEKPVRIAISKLGAWRQLHIEPPEMTSNGKEGLCTMRELKPHLVFVDMNMPIMDGCSFLNVASKEFPTSQFIVISGYDDFLYTQHAIRYGVCDYLLKPIVAEELNAAIRHAILKINPHETFNTQVEHEAITSDEIITNIKNYIDSNYCTNIKITDFEEKYFFSVEYLTKLFRQKYGCTMYEYVVQLRMERAIELLAHAEIKIVDISERLGYTDNHYFSKVFRRYYGVSPSQYRAKYTCTF